MPRALTSAEQTRAATLLVDASSRVRAHCRQSFTQVQTTEIIAPVDNQIILPQRPIISVDAVARVNADGKSFMPYSVWTWDGKATLMLGPPSAIVNAPAVWTDMDWFWRNVSYQIQYTHGYAVIPDDVIGVVAGMVLRVLMAPGSPGVISETIGGYSYRMADGFPTAQVDLTSADEKILKEYCGRRNRTIELR
jgi:hypothetical protein